MKNLTKYFILFGFIINGFNPLNAQENSNFFNKNIDYQVKGQISIGGVTPLSIPAQIRKIEKYDPKLQLGIGLNATKWLDNRKKFGVRLGVNYESRGMNTQAKVKNYYTQIADDTGAQTTGYFTGHVVTDVKNTYITVPVLFVWNVNNRWNLYGGFFVSSLINKSFTGYIYDGDFREGTPIGELTTFENTARGLYDFSDDLGKFQWGNQIGGEYKITNYLSVFADVTMANNQAFKGNFEAISFKMYNLFGNFGVGFNF